MRKMKRKAGIHLFSFIHKHASEKPKMHTHKEILKHEKQIFPVGINVKNFNVVDGRFIHFAVAGSFRNGFSFETLESVF